jgi:hypothetical protein
LQCKSIVGHRKNAIHKCLDNEIIIKGDDGNETY